MMPVLQAIGHQAPFSITLYSTTAWSFYSGFVWVLKNLESPGTLLWNFPGLESLGKRPLWSWKFWKSVKLNIKSMKCMEGSKENINIEILEV